MHEGSLTEWAARQTLTELIGKVASEGANLQRQTMAGGTEAAETVLFTARYDSNGRKVLRFVVKQLSGRPRREAEIYARLVQQHAPKLGPRLLGIHRRGETLLLVIEAVRGKNAWPWRDNASTAGLLCEVGRFHAKLDGADIRMPEWDYEAELVQAGQSAVEALDRCRYVKELRPLSRDLRPLNRIVEALPRLRGQLLAEKPFHRRPIHGDVHPGNALIRGTSPARPVLLDWGRAREGSPLEDASSMLQSLRLWEPEALSAHDSLIKHYLSGLGMERRLTESVRSAYWVAGASNALAGALTMHLWEALDENRDEQQRASAAWLAQNWLRVIRRSHAWAL
ncbi:MAG TPA: aminoglycoside phosphotransferase family protein [Devosia sp.]|jgi:Ser/Thr protein kinase RdoA (MazF antagonist)|nr:aminoglycoside phosphotransferase family protein [Devosia sp.]